MIERIPVVRKKRKKKTTQKKREERLKAIAVKKSFFCQSNMRVNILKVEYKKFKSILVSQGKTIKEGVAEAIKMYIKNFKESKNKGE